ncbi:MAG TPA: TonB family protein [Bryobacteraceae bacterium]|nr:TonB family protein [Bryobacteraceae bacterium]
MNPTAHEPVTKPGPSVSKDRRFLAHTVPGHPLTYLIDIAVLQKLEELGAGGLRAVPRRGLEVGGWLTGHTEASSSGRIIVVEDAVVFDTDYSFGPDFRISESDQQRLSQQLPAGRTNIVGIFRSHTRTEPAPTVDDHEFWHNIEPKQGGALLTVQPTLRGISTATLFRHTTTGFEREIEFPLREQVLEESEFVIVAEPGTPAARALPDPAPTIANRQGRVLALAAVVVALLLFVAYLQWHRAIPSQGPIEVTKTRSSDPVTVLGDTIEPGKDPSNPSHSQPSDPDKTTASEPIGEPPAIDRSKQPGASPGNPPPPVKPADPKAAASTTQTPSAPAEQQEWFSPRKVTLETVPEPVLKRLWNGIPGVRKLQRGFRGGKSYSPATSAKQVNPAYPIKLQSLVRNSPPIVVRVHIDERGRVERAKVLSKNVDSRLRQASIDAIRQWRFKPATLDGKPVASRINVIFHF